MILCIPTGTDAPIYHFPRVTIGMIVVNCFVFLITLGGYDPENEALQALALRLGDGLNPLQWITNNFVHFGITHIVFNMIFLWGFGLLVEGKIGWWRYLVVYLLIGTLVGFVTQVVNLGQVVGPHLAGGASTVIFGLIGISLIWAPKNDVTCFLFFWVFFYIRATTFEVTVFWFSLFYLVPNFLIASLNPFQISSEFLHTSGALVGLWIGLAMLKLKWVDCENWDLIAVMNGTYGDPERAKEIIARREGRFKSAHSRPLDQIEEGAPPPDRDLPKIRGSRNKRDSVERIRRLLTESKATAALAEYRSLKHFHPDWSLEEPELRALVNALFRAKAYHDAIPLMDDYIDRYPEQSDRIRLRRAGLALQVEQRPRLALRLVEPISKGDLTAPDVALLKKIHLTAKQLIERGVLELGDVG